MKKILFLADINSSHTRKWVSGVAELGYETAIFSISKPEYDWYSVHGIKLINNVFIIDHDTFSNGDFSKLKYFKLSGDLKKCVQAFSPDIIHAHYATSYGMLGMRTGIHPFVLSVWGSDVFEFPKRSLIHRYILRRIFKKADVLLSTSEIMKSEIAGYTDKNVEVTPFGIDTNIYCSSKNSHADVFRVGIIKSLEDHYGIDYLIRAFELILKKYPDKKFQLVIAGDGSKTEKYRMLVADLKLTGEIIFTGKLSQDTVPAMLNTFDVFVCPSLHESFGVSVLEASACEVPVIVSNAGGLKEVVKEGETGIVVNPGNAMEIANAISFFVDNPSLISQYGKRGRKFVIDNFDWKKNLVQIGDIYKRL